MDNLALVKPEVDKNYLCYLCPHRKFKSTKDNIMYDDKEVPSDHPGYSYCTIFKPFNFKLERVTAESNLTYTLKNCKGKKMINELNPEKFISEWLNDVIAQLFHVEPDDYDEKTLLPVEKLIVLNAINKNPIILHYMSIQDISKRLRVPL